MTHMSRHIVVAPILSAPLLTDTRRSTVGPGTREDIACVVVGKPSQYIMWHFAGNDDKKNIVFKYVELSVDEVNLEHWLRIHRRPGLRGETGAGRDELLWRLEDEDAAVLNCGVLMHIEPTGHLDVDCIRWLKDWLKSFAICEKYRRKGVLRNKLRRLCSCTCCQHQMWRASQQFLSCR